MKRYYVGGIINRSPYYESSKSGKLIMSSDFDRYKELVRELFKKKDEEIERLKEYLDHKGDCFLYNMDEDEINPICTCGFSKLLESE